MHSKKYQNRKRLRLWGKGGSGVQYITKAGDQWDIIAKNVYGDEYKADLLMSANFPLLNIFQFDAGMVVECPELTETFGETMPPWRT